MEQSPEWGNCGRHNATLGAHEPSSSLPSRVPTGALPGAVANQGRKGGGLGHHLPILVSSSVTLLFCSLSHCFCSSLLRSKPGPPTTGHPSFWWHHSPANKARLVSPVCPCAWDTPGRLPLLWEVPLLGACGPWLPGGRLHAPGQGR